MFGSLPLFSRLRWHCKTQGVWLLMASGMHCCKRNMGIRQRVLYYEDAEASTHFWLGRLTGLGAVTLPKDTIRPLGLQVTSCQVTTRILRTRSKCR